MLDALADVPGVWIVGGAVRDALIGRDPRDLDLVVEGDAGGGRAAARRGHGRARPLRHGHGRGRRSTSPPPAASATTRPGALPEVELGVPLREDLARRDFSVNAIAVRLADGALESVPGALEDLAARRLRALHERSFLDDPTRLLRLVRYGARLRFPIEEETREWAFAAVADGALATVTGPRLGAELRLLLNEPQPTAVCGLEGLRIGPQLLPGFRVDPDLVERAQRLTPADARADLVALAACCLDAGAAELAERLDWLEFTARERDIAVAAATRARSLAPVMGGMDRRVGAVGAAAPRGARDGRAGRRARRPRRRPAAGSTSSAAPAWRSTATTCSPPASPAPRSAAALDAAMGGGARRRGGAIGRRSCAWRWGPRRRERQLRLVRKWVRAAVAGVCDVGRTIRLNSAHPGFGPPHPLGPSSSMRS